MCMYMCMCMCMYLTVVSVWCYSHFLWLLVSDTVYIHRMSSTHHTWSWSPGSAAHPAVWRAVRCGPFHCATWDPLSHVLQM